MQITKPKTQRKKLFQAPAHRRHKHLSAHLAPNLKKKHGTSTIPVRSGDTVRVMRGERKGFDGKILRVDRKNYKVFVEGISREKVDGTSIPIPIHPSKVMITNLNLDDKWRREALKKRATSTSTTEEEQIAKRPSKRKRKRKTGEKATTKPKPEKRGVSNEKKSRKTAKAKGDEKKGGK